MKPDLPYLAALHGLGTLDADAMKSAVDSLMNDGFYVEECLEALDSKPARIDEVLPAFQAALEHYEVAVPDREQAVWRLIEHHLGRIVSQVEDPWSGLRGLVRDVYWEYDFHSKTTKYLGDSHGIQHLIGIYWDVDDLAGDSGLPAGSFQPSEQSMQAIRQAAQHWLASRGNTHAA